MAQAMIARMPFTTARGDLSGVFDKVINAQQPVVITRRKDDVVLIKRELQKRLLECYTVDVDMITEEDDSTTLAIDYLDIAVNADSQEEALADLVKEIKIYADDYLARLPLFLNAPNRKDHLPIILRVLLSEDDTEMVKMLRFNAP